MEIDKRVVAAVCTAVKEYIQAEKEAEEAVRVQTPRATTSLWSQSGRQEIMRNRQMWQLRIVPA